MRALPYTSSDDMVHSRRVIVGSMLTLMGFGLVVGYSSNIVSTLRTGTGADLSYLQGHLIKVLIALIAFLLAQRVTPSRLYAVSRPMWIVSIVLLVAVLIVGKEWNQAQRWFSVMGTSFQPSEVARLSTIVVVGAWMASAKDQTSQWRSGIVIPLVLVGLPAGMILIQPDLGSAVLLLVLGGLLMAVGGARMTHLLVGFTTSLLCLVFYGWSRFAHVSERFENFSSPEVGSQVWQSLTALGHGGVTGTGIAAGFATWGFLPEADSDFVFAVIGEELGLVGSLFVMALYALILWHGVRLLMGLRTRFSLVVGTGLLMQVIIQAILNVAVVTASVPPKGLPLPFVSLGGTSLLVMCASMGLLLGLSRAPEEDPVRGELWPGA